MDIRYYARTRCTDYLHHATAFSRRCRGIAAAGHSQLLYRLGVFQTLSGAVNAIDQLDAQSVFDVLRQACERTVPGLMTQLRAAAAAECDALHASSESEEQFIEGLRNGSIHLEPMPPDVYPQSDGTWDHLQGDDVDQPLRSQDGNEVTFDEVLARIADFSNTARGDWLLGHLEANTGMQAALALAKASARDRAPRREQLLRAIDLLRVQAMCALEPLVDALNQEHPFLHATTFTLCAEGLDDPVPRLIVADSSVE